MKELSDSDIERNLTSTLIELKQLDIFNRWLYEKIKKYVKGKVIEVGCGIGNLSKYFFENPKTKSIVLSDIDNSYIELAKKRFSNYEHLDEVIKWDVNFSLGGKTKFDTIICFNVLEHIEDDLAALENLRECLSDKGFLIILVPAFPSLFSQMDREYGHYRRYTRQSLKKILEKNKFHINNISYINLFGLFGWFINGKILKRTTLPNGQLKLFNLLSPLLLRIENIIRLPLGLSLIAVVNKI